MSGFRLLLDENVDPSLRAAIHQHLPELTVWCIGDPSAPGRGTLDPDILRWCARHQFSLVTNNRSSMPEHLRDHLARGEHVLGIFFLNSKMALGETASELVLISVAADPAEYRDRLVFLPESH